MKLTKATSAGMFSQQINSHPSFFYFRLQQGGITYYAPQSQPPLRPILPQRRPTNAIPIMAPPDRVNNRGHRISSPKIGAGQQMGGGSTEEYEDDPNKVVHPTENIDHILDNMFVQRAPYQSSGARKNDEGKSSTDVAVPPASEQHIEAETNENILETKPNESSESSESLVSPAVTTDGTVVEPIAAIDDESTNIIEATTTASSALEAVDAAISVRKTLDFLQFYLMANMINLIFTDIVNQRREPRPAAGRVHHRCKYNRSDDEIRESRGNRARRSC